MKNQIRTMLTDAYCMLGVMNAKDINDRIEEALDYLEKDRERYIEVAEPDRPEYLISIQQGVICKLIPLGRNIIIETDKECVQKYTAVLSLMVTDEDVWYVMSYANVKLFDDPRENTYSYPVYRYTRLENIKETLQVISPQENTPVVTPIDREIFGMIFVAIAKYSNNLPINFIPHKVERAMLAVAYSLPTELNMYGQPVVGKLIPLARGSSMWEETREDHRYSYMKELCLLITEGEPRYVLKTHHTYRYFRKVVFDDVTDGCSYEPTDEKQEITYIYVELGDINEELYPLYY